MDLLITVASLIVTIYAVTPRERQLTLLVKLSSLELAGFLIAVVCATLYLNYYDFFAFHSLAIPADKWPCEITPVSCIPLVLLLGILFLWLRIKYSGLSPRRIDRFQVMTEEMLWSGSHAELLAILQQHIRPLFRIHRGEFGVARLRQRLSRINRLESMEEFVLRMDAVLSPSDQHAGTSRPTFFSQTRNRIEGWCARPLLHLLPDFEEESRKASEMIRSLFLNPSFVASLARIRPYLGLIVITEWSKGFDRKEFVELYFAELMRDPTSVLYFEIANNQNQLNGFRYDLPTSNRLLFYLFKDAKVAHTLEVYRPVGETVLQELDHLHQNPQNDPYNDPMGNFMEGTCWRSPIFIAIRFFDIMVTEALFQDVKWHMWLYYFTHFVDKIVANYNPRDTSEGGTRPNRYSELLYQIFRTLEDWCSAVEEIPKNQENVSLDNTRAIHDSNIPKSSILALGQCVFTVVSPHPLGMR